MAVTKFIGFEVGDASELTSLGSGHSVTSAAARTGGYGLRATDAGPSTVAESNWHNRHVAFWFRVADATPSADFDLVTIASWVRFRLRTNGTLAFQLDQAQDGSWNTTVGSTPTISDNTWYHVVLKTDSDPPYYHTWWLDGVNQGVYEGGGQLTTTSTLSWSGLSGNTVDFDDLMNNHIDSTTITMDRARVILRKVEAGTETYTEWNDTSPEGEWADVPYSAASSITSPGSGDPLRQTAHVAASSSGTDAVGASDTILAHKTAGVALRSAGSGRTHEWLTRINSTDYFSGNLALSTSDAYYEQINPAGATQPTLAQLDAAEIGGRKSGGAGGRSMTIEDVWLMVAYEPAAAAGDPLPKPIRSPFALPSQLHLQGYG